MCAIAGFYRIHKDDLLEQLSLNLAHRGPDGEGIYTNDSISLLNRRLAIIDRKGGDQPIFNEDKTLVVVYNGEIYNHIELREILEKVGHQFKTKSDTEIIIHAYEEWGYEAFDKFNGMFAFALYDIKEDKLILARDHFGIKPLYYSFFEDNKIIFSSEITPILRSGLLKEEVNERILYRYLRFRIHDNGKETFFKNIYRLLPGELMVIQESTHEIVHYSTLEKSLQHDKKLQNKSDRELENTFLTLLKDSIKKRLVSEVPVGSALSGGIDSSAIVTVINEYLNQDGIKDKEKMQNTFSAVFPGSINDEEVHVDKILKKATNIRSHKIFPKSDDFVRDLDEYIRTQEEPTISTGPYAQFQVMKAAKNYVTVLLDGQGADELMAGYLPYYFVYWNQLHKKRQYFNLFKELWNSHDVFFKYSILKLQQILAGSHQINIDTLLSEKFRTSHKKEKFTSNINNLKNRLLEDIFCNSLPALLRYEDRNTMHFSLEGRVPFLDKRLVQFIFSLPDKFIIRNGWNKYILRESLKEVLPESIRLRRSKIGFTTPEHEWFLNKKEQIYKIFLSESFANRPYWDGQKVLKTFRLFLQGKNDDTMVFWRLINVELWLREYIDESKNLESDTSVQKSKKDSKYILGQPNEGKKIKINYQNASYSRIPIKTDRFSKGDEYSKKIAKHIASAISNLSSENLQNMKKKKWYVISSEKIVAISQGRSFFIWDIKPTWWASTLSSFVSRTPYGIGLGSPWTMQIAIDEVGLPRILFAAFASITTKPFGIRGVFYRIAGPQAAAIDGPTEYSLFPSNVSAKLAPKDPDKAVIHIKEAIEKQVTDSEISSMFGGAVIIDANDIGRNVMGNATDKPNQFFEGIMRDNPMGQGSEQTPLVIAV